MDEDRGGDGVADTIRGLVDDMPGAARGAIGTARDLYRRGAMAVTRTSGDSGALMLMAGGAAIAGLSWLLVRRAKRKPRA
jgi:LPXTG-motif cell wall-anchored protein